MPPFGMNLSSRCLLIETGNVNTLFGNCQAQLQVSVLLARFLISPWENYGMGKDWVKNLAAGLRGS
jgi:hypothetical protein